VAVAIPLVIVPLPICVPLSRKVIVPVAKEGEIVAVNVTPEPKVEGFKDEVRAIVGFALLTICVTAEEVLTS
jgi:hypothetical protein